MTAAAFHDRPICTVAVGFLLGTALVRCVAPPNSYAVVAVLLLVCVAARWTSRRRISLLLLAMALSLALISLRYPADGVFPVTGRVFEPTGELGVRLEMTRDAIGERIDVLFPQNGGLAKGMLLGEKGDIAADLLDQFKSTGIMHILAISGLHVSILASAFSLLFRRNAWVRFAFVLLFLLAYAALTAFSPSVVRASLMLLCYTLAFPLLRRPDTANALALSFIVILLCNPLALFYTGFQLSYCAVYGLILLGAPIAHALRRLGGAASSAIGSSVAVTVATLPAMAATFGRVQLLSVLTNLLVLPFVPFFLVPALLGTALSYLSFPLGNAICAVARVSLDIITAVASVGGKLDVTVSAPNGLAYLLFLAALPFLSPLCLLEPYKKLRNACALLCAALTAWVIW